eukprot:scaffold54939_cov62-Cyclotella_meneghiniana.AAC.5
MAMPPFFGAREEWESDGAWPPVGTVFVYSFEYPPAAFFVILSFAAACHVSSFDIKDGTFFSMLVLQSMSHLAFNPATTPTVLDQLTSFECLGLASALPQAAQLSNDEIKSL